MEKAQKKRVNSRVGGPRGIGYLRSTANGPESLGQQAGTVEVYARRAGVQIVPFVDEGPVAASGKWQRASCAPLDATRPFPKGRAGSPAASNLPRVPSAVPQVENRVPRLAFYIRRAARIDDQAVIVRQRGNCSAVAEALGAYTSEDYVDDGYSGLTTERPALRKLIADVEAGLIDGIVVEDLDRLRRSDQVGLELRDLLLSHGVELHAAGGGGIDWLVSFDRLFGARSTG